MHGGEQLSYADKPAVISGVVATPQHRTRVSRQATGLFPLQAWITPPGTASIWNWRSLLRAIPSRWWLTAAAKRCPERAQLIRSLSTRWAILAEPGSGGWRRQPRLVCGEGRVAGRGSGPSSWRTTAGEPPSVLGARQQQSDGHELMIYRFCARARRYRCPSIRSGAILKTGTALGDRHLLPLLHAHHEALFSA